MDDKKEEEFQTLYWLPLLSETASQATEVIADMLGLIHSFHEEDLSPEPRPSFAAPSNHHRQVVLGDMLDTEVSKTFVEVVPKSENTRYTILSTLKVSQRLFKIVPYNDDLTLIYASSATLLVQPAA